MHYINNPHMDSDALIARFERDVLNAPVVRRRVSPLESYKKGLVKKLPKAIKKGRIEAQAEALAPADESTRAALVHILSATDEDDINALFTALQSIENPSDNTSSLIQKFERSVVNAEMDAPLTKLRRVIAIDLFSSLHNEAMSADADMHTLVAVRDERIREAIDADPRFESYPRLREALRSIYAPDETPESIFAELQTIDASDWQGELTDEKRAALQEAFPVEENNREALFQLYGKLVESTRKIAVLYEQNNTPEEDMPHVYAHQILTLFLDPDEPIDDVDAAFDAISRKVNTFLTKTSRKLDLPFHDAFIVELSGALPTESIDMPGWRALIEREGLAVLPALNMAERIEEKIALETGEERAPHDADEAARMMLLCNYARAEEDKAFAELCNRHHVPEYMFDAGLDYMQEPPGWPKKSVDNIPDVLVEGAGAADGFWIKKLPADDKRALILGQITDCCQSIAGHSEQCVKDGSSLTDNGFYVIVKGKNPDTGKIIGQAYAWRTQRGNLCLDSIECLQNNIGNNSLQALMNQLSEAVIEATRKDPDVEARDEALAANPEIHRVTIGMGGKTPHGIFPETAIPEEMKQGVRYYDSSMQYYITTHAMGRLYESIRERLPEVLQSISDYQYVLEHLSPEQGAEAYESMLERLPKLIQSMFDVKYVLEHLSPEQGAEAYESMLERLPRLIQSMSDVKYVLEHLSPEQGTKLYESIRERLPEVVKHIDDIKYALAYLSPEQGMVFLEGIREHLPEMIRDQREFNRLVKDLSPEQRTEVYESMRERIPEMIQSGFDDESMLKHLSSAQRTEVYEIMRERLPELIQSPEDFQEVLYYLNPEQGTEVYESMRERLPGMIQYTFDFHCVLVYLSPAQRTEVYESVRERLPGILQRLDIDCLGEFLCCLNPEQVREVCESMQESLPRMMRNTSKFNIVLRALNPEQRTAVFESTQNDLSSLIKSARDLVKIVEYLTPEQRAVIYERIDEFLPELIDMSEDNFKVLALFPSEKHQEIRESLEAKLLERQRDITSEFKDTLDENKDEAGADEESPSPPSSGTT